MKGVGQAAVGLLGLYALADNLSQVPGRIQLARAFPVIERGASSIAATGDIGPPPLTASGLGVVLMCILPLVPGLAVLLARRRLASWLAPESALHLTGLDGRTLLHTALVVLGSYCVVNGLVGFAAEGSLQFAFGHLTSRGSLPEFARPFVLTAAGVALCILAPSLAGRFSTYGHRHEGA